MRFRFHQKSKAPFQQLGKESITTQYQNIPTESAATFFERLQQSAPIRFVGSGSDGLVLMDRYFRTWKLSFAILEANGILAIDPSRNRISDAEKRRLKQQWPNFKTLSNESPDALRIQQAYEFHKNLGLGIKNNSLTREIWGGMFRAAYSSAEDGKIPDLVSEDGYAYRTKYKMGIDLDHWIKLDQTGSSGYSREAVFREVIRLQRINQTIFEKTGFMVDLFNPGNFILSGPPLTPHIAVVDYSMSYANQEVSDWRVRSIQTPLRRNIVPGELISTLGAFPFPTSQTIILSSELWRLSYEQALSYVAVLFHTDQNESKTHLANLYPFRNERYPQVMNYSNIERARTEMGNWVAIPLNDTTQESQWPHQQCIDRLK